ncbi:EF-hand domain [Dillenia turbinata]|uniref:EF-hand domain n=1 Tax=Dillenia turbinata TaxID=194707 RepID=A0AAN8VSX5_9MAGN
MHMTSEEFKKHLLNTFDKDNDGRLNAEELRALKTKDAGFFTRLKEAWDLYWADKNGNGFIDDDTEFKRLEGFAKPLGITLVKS